MSDLVTRLLALAEENIDAGRCISGRAIREAADALGNLQERLDREHSMALSSQQYMEQERDALKAKLAEAVDAAATFFSDAKKAEAEASALREALQYYADNFDAQDGELARQALKLQGSSPGHTLSTK